MAGDAKQQTKQPNYWKIVNPTRGMGMGVLGRE
jgi:hypothetical protein